MFYRASRCKTCKVKSGLGNCPACVELRGLLGRLETAVIEQFGGAAAATEVEIMDPGYSTEPDESEEEG